MSDVLAGSLMTHDPVHYHRGNELRADLFFLQAEHIEVFRNLSKNAIQHNDKAISIVAVSTPNGTRVSRFEPTTTGQISPMLSRRTF